MIRHKQDNSFLTCVLKNLQDRPDFVVQIGDVSKVPTARAPYLIFSNVVATPVIRIKDATRMRVMVLIPKRRNRRQQVFAILIKVPILAPRHIGVMRMRETHRHTPRTLLHTPRQIVKLLLSQMCDLVVILHLVRDLGNASPRHRPHVVVPPVDALAWFPVIRCPTIVRRVDVGRQPFLKSMKLIRPYKMHLA